jgi:hypothetical protein
VISIATGAYLILAAIVLAVVFVDRVKARLYTQKALSYCRRATDGEIYVTDPKTGTAHKLSDLLVKRALGAVPHASRRQRRKVQAHVRRALGV